MRQIDGWHMHLDIASCAMNFPAAIALASMANDIQRKELSEMF